MSGGVDDRAEIISSDSKDAPGATKSQVVQPAEDGSGASNSSKSNKGK